MPLLLVLLLSTSVLAFIARKYLGRRIFGRAPAGPRLERIEKVPNYRDGTFHNLSPTPVMVEGVTLLSSAWDYLRPDKDRQPSQPLPSVKIDLNKLPDEGAFLVWFGHSSYMLKIAGRTILVDPVFSGHASPVSFFGKNYPGSNEYEVADMPEIDILLLTHDHYDHLDYGDNPRTTSQGEAGRDVAGRMNWDCPWPRL